LETRKKAFVVIGAAAAIAAAFFLFKKDPCFVEYPVQDDNLVSMKVGSKSVHLVGWYHGSVEWDMAQIAFNSAYADAQSGNCKRAQETLRGAFPKLKTKADESLRVQSLLETIYRQQSFDILGLEHAPYQYQSLHVNDGSSDMSFKYLTKFEEFCPQELSTFKRMYQIYPGPEYEFARNKSDKIRLVPMGDDLLIKKSLDALSEENWNFQLRVNEMSPDAIEVFEKLVERTKSQPLPENSELDAMTKNLKEPEKGLLKNYFTETMLVLKLIPERDAKFAVQILKQNSEHVVLVIGSRHLTGIKNQLHNFCK
jgi:hypothetical protein